MRQLFIFLIRIYQRLISPLLGPHCRYYPTCSQYSIEAIRLHGAVQGSYLGLKRLMRCHPGREGGYDPVPVPESTPAVGGHCCHKEH